MASNRGGGYRMFQGRSNAGLFVPSRFTFGAPAPQHLLEFRAILAEIVEQAGQTRLLFKAGHTQTRFDRESLG
ncbi:MAG TPA: hypothetical protein VHY91_12965 [Pirellulales bacterium]|nr:hypothetical protein [Pirellulales bacterium]